MQATVTGGSGTVDVSVTRYIHLRQAATRIKAVFLTSAFVEGFTSTGRVRAGFATTFKARVAPVTIRLAITGSPTGGNFRIAYTDSTINRTATINHNATVAQVQAALDTLMASVSTQTNSPVTATVTGSTLPAGTMDIVLNSPDPLHSMFGLHIVNAALTGGTTPTVTLTPTSGAFSDFQFPTVDSGPSTSYANWGYNEGLIVSYPLDFTVVDGQRIRMDMVWNAYTRDNIAGAAARWPIQNGFTNCYQARKQWTGRYTLDAITTGNDIIAGTGTPTPLALSNPPIPHMILGQVSGLTRRLNVLVYSNSITGRLSQSITSVLENMGYNVIPWGHSASAPREAMDDPEFRYLAGKCDAFVWAASENIINPQALDSSSYFGGATATDTSRLVDELWDMAEEIGKPFFVVPPYLMGLNTADITVPLLTKTQDDTAYKRCLDFRSRVAARIASDPRNGVLADVYGPIIVDHNDPTITKKYASEPLLSGGNGFALWRLDSNNVSGNAPTDDNVFAWRMWQLTDASGDGMFRGVRWDGGDNTQATGFQLRHKPSQEIAFGPTYPDHSVGIGFLQQDHYTGSKLYCYKGGGSPSPIGETRTIRTTAGSAYGLNGHNTVWRVDEIATVGVAYADSWWLMERPGDNIGDNNGSPSATSGLHLQVGLVSALWWRWAAYEFHPLMQGIAREA